MKAILYRVKVIHIKGTEIHYISADNEKEAIIEVVLSTGKSIDAIEIQYLSNLEDVLVAKEDVKEL